MKRERVRFPPSRKIHAPIISRQRASGILNMSTGAFSLFGDAVLREDQEMDVMILLCLLAALAGAGYGWFSMARKESEHFKRRLVDRRSET